jgi:methylated-DNA-[protein]-cysteine S-methyltransferase
MNDSDFPSDIDRADIRHATSQTILGELTLVADGNTLVGVYFPGHWVGIERAALGRDATLASDPFLSGAALQLNEYLGGERTAFDIVIETRGGDFEQRVWAMLRDIPFGATVTYGELATRLGNPMLARKVGQAVGFNPLSIVIPCHRVVGSNGKLTGYAGGLERKKILLALEEPVAAVAGRLF